MRRHKILALVVVLGRRAGRPSGPGPTEGPRGIHQEDPRVHDRPVLPDQVRQLPALRRGRPHAARGPRPHRRGQGRPELLGRRLQVHAGPGRGDAAGQGLRHRQDRGGPRLDRGRRRRRGDHQEPRQVQGDQRQAGRSPQAHRGRSPGPPQGSQAHLLGHGRPPLRARPARSRCSWSWPTASPSTSRPSSRPSARTPSP